MTGRGTFIGSRPQGRGQSEAVRLKKLEIMKGGKLPLTSAERYKRILDKKMEEHQAQIRANSTRVMSKKAQDALKQIAMKKANKEEKKLRQMVVVQPRSFSGVGRIDAKGKIYDLADGMVLKVDAKKGRITTMGGMAIGKYKPKSMMTNFLITESIKKYSPYFIKLRQMELLAQQQQQQMINDALARGGIYGAAGDLISVDMGQGANSLYGPSDLNGDQHRHQHPGNNATVNAWGVSSNNIHGTFGENVWGGMADNVWGGASSNVWGGIGGSAWSKRGMKIWGSGSPNQKNYLKGLGVFLSAMLGFKGKVPRFGRSRMGRMGGGGGRSSGRSAGRTGGR